MVSYTKFWNHLESIDTHRKNRLRMNRISIHADFLKERSGHSGIDFDHLMQADFVLLMRTQIKSTNSYDYWWPITLIYSEYKYSAFDIFARAQSKRYFNRMKHVISIDKKEDLHSLQEDYQNQKRRPPQWGFVSVEPFSLMGFDHLATND